MTHAAARRCGDARNKANHGFFNFGLFEERGGFFFGGAADFADHDHALGLVIA